MTTTNSKEENSVWLFCGADEYAVNTQAKKTVEKLCPPKDQTFGLETIDAAVEKADDALIAVNKCYDGLRTAGFFGTGKVIWLKDASFLGKTSKPSTEAVKKALARLSKLLKSGLPSGHSLVITSNDVFKSSAFYKALKTCATIKEFTVEKNEAKQDKQAFEQAATCFKKADLKISAALLRQFVERIGMHGRQIVQEVEKLRSYFGEGGTITEEVLDQLVAPTKEALIWSVADAVIAKDLPKSLAHLKKSFLQKESPVGIVSFLEGRISKLILMKSCIERGWVKITGSGYKESAVWSLPAKMEDYLGKAGLRDDPRKGHPYAVLMSVKKAMTLNMKELIWCREKALLAHKKMLKLQVPKELLLELLVVELAGR